MEELLREKSLRIAVLICFVTMVISIPFYSLSFPMTAGSFLKFYQNALQAQTLLFLIPIVSVLPMGASYVREVSSGFLKLYITRISRMRYVRRKILQLYGGGFLPFFLGGLCAMLICFAVIYPFEYQGGLSGEDFLNVLLMLLRISLIGGTIAEISGFFAAVFQNYYMAYGLPFVIYYMLIILKERYLPDMYAMYPKEWIICEQDWGMEGAGIWVFLILLSIAAVLLHGLALHERLQEIC